MAILILSFSLKYNLTTETLFLLFYTISLATLVFMVIVTGELGNFS